MTLPRFLLAAALFVPATAFAQPAMPDLKLFAASADVQALIAKAKADRKGDAPLTNERLLNLAPYAVNLEYRPLKAPAAVHVKEAELMYVVQGTGTLVTGGKLTGVTPADPANARAALNPSGTGIEGGTPLPFTPGAIAFVPENTPHQVIPDAGSTLVLITFHVPRPVAGN